MNLVALKAELVNDPLTRGYAGMSDEAAAVSLNTPNRTPDRLSITGGMIAASMVRTELAALTAADQNYVRALLPCDQIPLTATIKTELSNIFGAGTTTRTNLLAMIKRTGSRAEELNLGEPVTPSHIADARRLP